MPVYSELQGYQNDVIEISMTRIGIPNRLYPPPQYSDPKFIWKEAIGLIREE